MNRHSLRLCLILLAMLSLPAAGHDLRYQTESGHAVIIHLSYGEDLPFSFESYEIRRQEDSWPYQSGRTDARGRIAFLPDSPGLWRVKAFSEDGHGVEFDLETGADQSITTEGKSLFERHGPMVAGVALILGLFGLLSLYARRKPK